MLASFDCSELLRNSTHVLDTLVYLLDTRAERVSGYVTGENEAVETMEADVAVDDAGGGGHVVMDDGTFVTVDCTIPRDVSSMLFSFVGTKGKLYLNNNDGEWRYWRLEDGNHVEADLPGIEGSWTWDEDYQESFVNAAVHLRDVLNGEAENASPGVEAKRSLKIIIAFYLSHHTGGHVEVPLERPLRDGFVVRTVIVPCRPRVGRPGPVDGSRHGFDMGRSSVRRDRYRLESLKSASGKPVDVCPGGVVAHHTTLSRS